MVQIYPHPTVLLQYASTLQTLHAAGRNAQGRRKDKILVLQQFDELSHSH